MKAKWVIDCDYKDGLVWDYRVDSGLGLLGFVQRVRTYDKCVYAHVYLKGRASRFEEFETMAEAAKWVMTTTSGVQ